MPGHEHEPKIIDLPKFPNEGFLRKPVGPSKVFSFMFRSSHGELLCSPCGHVRRPSAHRFDFDDQYRRIYDFGGIQIVNGCCGHLLDVLNEAGFIATTRTDDLPRSSVIKNEVLRAIAHPEYKTSQKTLAKIQEAIDKINNGA